MLSTTLLNVLAFLPQGGVGTSNAPVVINEFNYDDSGADTLEYVEIYNRSGLPVDMSNWTLVGDDANGVNFTQVIPVGTILLPGDFFVIGDSNVSNIDIVLASGFLQNDNESITMFDASSAIVDTLIYEANKGIFNALLVEGEGIWGNFTLAETNPTSWSRMRDGYDTNNNGHDFRLQPWSPGTSNNQVFVPQLVETFDGLAVGADVPGWEGSFVRPRAIDPTVIDSNNPTALPASPQGGFAGIAWDPSGGGDHCMLSADVADNVRVEAYVYIESAPLIAGELEMWSFGFGTSGTFYNFPDPALTQGFTANGDTGLVWTYVRTDAGATMYLMDRNDGGLGATAISDAVVLGSVPIVAGVNDGWQRVLVDINGTNGLGRFGGTFGVADGTAFTATVASVDRGLYIGYREGVAGTAGARPFTFDFLFVEMQQAAEAAAYGAGCDGLTLSANGQPSLGNASFALNVNNVTVGPVAFIGFGTTAVNPGLDLSFVGMAGCSSYTTLDIGVFTTGAVLGGSGSLPLPIPTSTGLMGQAVASQGLAFSLTTALQLGATNGVALYFGN